MKKSRETAQSLLKGAYAIETADENLAYYKDFAPVYDAGFARALGYVTPQAVAQFYHQIALPRDVPVADIGCGTGLVAQALDLLPRQIEGFDISPDMLRAARAKNLYRRLHRVDLTRPVTGLDEKYGAILSAGTFTHGHLGPGPLIHLLDLAKPQGVFCISVSAGHYSRQGFAPMLDALHGQGKITRVRHQEIRIYDKPDHDHSGDKGLILTFRKT